MSDAEPLADQRYFHLHGLNAALKSAIGELERALYGSSRTGLTDGKVAMLEQAGVNVDMTERPDDGSSSRWWSKRASMGAERAELVPSRRVFTAAEVDPPQLLAGPDDVPGGLRGMRFCRGRATGDLGHYRSGTTRSTALTSRPPAMMTLLKNAARELGYLLR